jgi:hypothetical protein
VPVRGAHTEDKPPLGPEAVRRDEHPQDLATRSASYWLIESSTQVMNPRLSLSGIPFGPEVTAEERERATTLHRRGLLFACYQSSIDNGFSFMQQGEMTPSSICVSL